MQNGQAVFFELDPLRGKGRELTRAATGPRIFGDWTLSPDGSMVAMTSLGTLPATIYIVYLDRAPLEKDITVQGPAFTGSLSWAPDGKGWYIAVEDRQTRLIDWTGHNRFVYDVGYWMVPSWDGRHMAYVDRERNFNVWMIDR